jgi:hypothetical protein
MEKDKQQKRKVTRVRHGIEGDQKLADDEYLMYDKKTGSYYAVKEKSKNDVNAHKNKVK